MRDEQATDVMRDLEYLDDQGSHWDALYGQDLLRVVEAANSIRQDRLLMVQIQILRREIAVTILRNV